MDDQTKRLLSFLVDCAVVAVLVALYFAIKYAMCFYVFACS